MSPQERKPRNTEASARLDSEVLFDGPGYGLAMAPGLAVSACVLACLYTLRIIAGGTAVAIWPSVWLLASSILLFVSLALLKRNAELVLMRSVEGDHATARGYRLSDAELLAAQGTASGYAAVVVRALHIASGAVKTLYSTHQVLWFVCPLLLYWVGYLWLVAHRGEMVHDPLVFAVRNRTSRMLILLMLATALIAI